MKKFMKSFMREHKSILTLKETNGFHYFNKKTIIEYIPLITIYSTLFYLMLFVSHTLSFVYYGILLGSILITSILTLQRETQFQKENKITYHIKNSIIIHVHRVLLIFMMVFSVNMIIHYSTELTMFDLIFHSVIFLLVIIFEVIKYKTEYEYQYDYLFINAIIIVINLVIFDITASIISHVSLGIELFLITLIMLIIFLLKKIFSMIPSYNKYAWVIFALLLLTSFVFKGNAIDKMQNNGYTHICHFCYLINRSHHTPRLPLY